MIHISLDKIQHLFILEDVDLCNKKNRIISLKNIISAKKKLIINDKNIMFSIVEENYCWEKIDKYLPHDIDVVLMNLKLYNINIYWAINDVANTYIFKNIKNIIFFNYFALKTYYIIFFENHPYNKEWNYNYNMGLFLIGKILKPHRVGLLYFLYKKDLLKKCYYSSYLNNDKIDNTYMKIKNIIFNIDKNINTDFNFDDFFIKCQNKLDDINIELIDIDSHYQGFPYDVSLYENSSISLISETNDVDYFVWLTEKTFRAIVNNHPFLIIGPIGTNKKLNEIGFRTFDKYMYHKNYDMCSIEEHKIEMVSENLEYFLNNIYNFKNEIDIDVKYNFNLFKIFCENEIKKFTNLQLDIKIIREMGHWR